MALTATRAQKRILGEAAGLSIGGVLAALAAVMRGKACHVVGAVAQPSCPRASGRNEFERLEAAASTGRLAFDIAVARIEGRFRPVGSLHIGRRLGHELDTLRFNPWNTGGGMEPAGWLNDSAAMRDLADRELEQRQRTASSARQHG